MRREEEDLEGELCVFQWFRTVGLQLAPFWGGRVAKWAGAGTAGCCMSPGTLLGAL